MWVVTDYGTQIVYSDAERRKAIADAKRGGFQWVSSSRVIDPKPPHGFVLGATQLRFERRVAPSQRRGRKQSAQR